MLHLTQDLEPPANAGENQSDASGFLPTRRNLKPETTTADAPIVCLSRYNSRAIKHRRNFGHDQQAPRELTNRSRKDQIENKGQLSVGATSP